MAGVELPQFAQWLTVSMDNQGLSGRKLAKQLGYTDGMVVRWKKGERVPSPGTLIKIAKIFDVTPGRLLVTARPDEFPAADFGEPLAVPSPKAYRRRVREYLHSGTAPIREVDAQALDRMFAATELLRHGDGHIEGEVLDIIEEVRQIIRGERKTSDDRRAE